MVFRTIQLGLAVAIWPASYLVRPDTKKSLPNPTNNRGLPIPDPIRQVSDRVWF